MNGPLPPERSGEEELPLIPISPALNRRQRAQALSQLSLQSAGSHIFDETVFENDDLSVSITTVSL